MVTLNDLEQQFFVSDSGVPRPITWTDWLADWFCGWVSNEYSHL